MRVTTLNLQGFDDWEKRKPHILSFLKSTNPDVILFQEAVFLPKISSHNQVQILNQTLGYSYEHSSITRLQVGLKYKTYREGLAFLSKFPVTKTDTIILKKDPLDEHNRIIQLIDILVNGQIIKLANVHFSLTDTTDFATAHLAETLAILKSRGEERIIAGDFNINNLDDLAELWQDHYTASTTSNYVSYPSKDKRLDYALIPKSYSLDSILVSGDDLSDHRAVTVDVRLRPGGLLRRISQVRLKAGRVR